MPPGGINKHPVPATHLAPQQPSRVRVYTMTSSYLKALLKLSGDEALADARMRLIDGLNWEELEIVAVEGITGCTNRKVRERLVCAMLNILKENPNVEPLTVPKTGKYKILGI